MSTRPLLALAAALTTGLLFASTATAAPLGARSASVSYAGLDLMSPTGRAEIERRVEGAADRVCRVRGAMDLRQVQAAADCRTAAVASGLAQVEQAVAAVQSSRQFAAASGSVGAQ